MASFDTIPVIGIERHRIALDGPGVRTLIGTFGCPLRCRYCINSPWSREWEVMQYTPEELYREIKADDLYFQATQGGLTFGGGEPLLHIEPIAAFTKLCPKTWSLWAETSLAVPSEAVVRSARLFDHFLVDIKSTDASIYHAYTGGHAAPVLKNLQLLLNLAGPERITVRLPQIPGYTSKSDLLASEQKLLDMGITDIDHLVYEKDVQLF